MQIKITKPRAIILALAVSLVVAGVAIAGKPDWIKEQEGVSNQIAQQQIAATPYPVDQMKHSLERDNLKARLLRFNKPDKIGYLYVMSFGKFVGYYAVKGKISSTQSQLTNTVQTWDSGSGADTVGESVGDDGSFGENEGGDRGVFFFTTTGVLVETTLDWIYSDSPLTIDVPNLIAKKA